MPSPVVRVTHALVAVIGLTLSGCDGSAPTAFALSWVFADGRDCLNSGAATVAIVLDGTSERTDCYRGLAPASNTFAVSPRDLSVHLEALSFDRSVLYRGDALFSITPTFATVTLYADGAR